MVDEREELIPSFVCKRCKREIVSCSMEIDGEEVERTLCWNCFKILKRLYEKEHGMLWDYHTNTISVDNKTISPYHEAIVLSS
jgi:hypothetical protein